MFSLFKKELSTFFCSLTGYLVVAVFLTITGLFLWVIPGQLNIIYGGYATLESLFDIAPWIYLFLVPAISMRFIAEERKQGTLELLLIRPLPAWQIVLAKYLAGFSLVAISILPTLVYVVVVWQMGEPIGNIDMGATIGSYIGLFLLASVYVAVSLFASSLTDNQIVAFVLGVALCFMLYTGFDSTASLPSVKSIQDLIVQLGVSCHYDSISRGVADSRDVVYFISLALFFMAITTAIVSRGQIKMLQWLLMPIIFIVVNILASVEHFRIDLTSEGRFTLSDVSKNYLQNLNADVTIKLYLDGELNPGFNRLKKATTEMINELDVCANKAIRYMTLSPADMAKKEYDALQQKLSEVGMGGVPVFETKEDGRKTRTIVYPYLQVSAGDSYMWVNLLENIPGLSSDENLNRSVEDLEYKIVDAIHRITSAEKPRIAFLEGHGELSEIDVVEATDALSHYFAVDRGQIGSDASILDPYKAIIIAKPTSKFTETEKFVIDQYVMRGGRVLWLVDAVNMTLDTLRNAPHTIGLYADFNIEDMLFVYGFRVNPEVVEDINCGMVPISVQQQGEGTQIVPMPWHFSPLLSTNTANPITRNVSLVKGDFTSYIDTVGEELNLVRTPLLRTSAYTKVDRTPVFASLASIHEKPIQSEYNRSHLNVAMLSEGSFKSVFAHRKMPIGVRNATQIAEHSKPTKMIVVADGDVIRNDVRFRESDNPTIIPLGYDELSRQTFGNKDFIVNAMLYLADDDGWMTLRNRTFSIRLLNKQMIGEGTSKWKFLSVAMPLIVMAIVFASVFVWRRKRWNS